MAEQPDVLDVLFDEAIDRTIKSLPDEFVDRLGSVAIVVEDEPTPAQLASVGARGLYGLYQGVPRTRWGVDNAAVPSKITLFRGPLVRSSRSMSSLARAVESTLLHEIAHHFGISDERIRELQHRH
jgi:predicted Zn-dependent protease with MMP-like domain